MEFKEIEMVFVGTLMEYEAIKIQFMDMETTSIMLAID